VDDRDCIWIDIHAQADFAISSSNTLALELCALWLSIPQAHAERLILSTSDIRANWIYPIGAIQLDAPGPFRSVFIEKNINPFAKATVRGAGAALSFANRAFDGDPLTGWIPPEGTPIEDWQIEIDFGQVLPLQQIRLQFEENAPPLGFFTISLSKGEGFINSANVLAEIAYGLIQNGGSVEIEAAVVSTAGRNLR
jgi:hypothetical protein